MNSVLGQAFEAQFRTEEKKQVQFLGVSLERGVFKVDEDLITGAGLKLDFSRHFEAPFKIETSLFTALNASQQSQISFSGLGVAMYYDLWGRATGAIKNTFLNDRRISEEIAPIQNSLQIGLGVDQFYLNGNKTVYSSSGLSLGLSYTFNLFNYLFKASTRVSQMTANKEKVNATFFSLGIVFPL